MGFIGSILGTQSGNTGGAGLNYQAGSADLIQGADAGQAQQLFNQQQDFIRALQAQNGVANQSAVFQQQQDLANQLQQAAQGGGPNPALAQLNQTTGQNVANQAALMASQRGASANPALLARQAAQQGAATQQNAVGQAATLAAQQQIAARQALQQQQGMMAGLSTQQVGQLGGTIDTARQATLNAIAQQNAARVGNIEAQNKANASVAGVAATQQGELFKGLMSSLGAAAQPKAGAAHGGMINYADGGTVPMPQSPTVPPVGARSYVANFFKGIGGEPAGTTPVTAPAQQPMQPYQQYQQGFTGIGNLVGKGIGAAASGIGSLFSSSPSEQPTSSDAFEGQAKAAKGGQIRGESYAKKMKPVPGKAKAKGDTLKNDTVPAMLSPGEIIIPRSIAQHPDAPNEAAKFVAAVLAGHGPSPQRKK